MKLSLMPLLFIALFTGSVAVNAAPRPDDPAKQTPWNLYLDSREAYEMKQAKGDQVLFVDVRDPVEIHFTGFTDVVDENIPFKVADATQWNGGKSLLQMVKNPNFEQDIEKAMLRHGLTKADPLILMCRSGGTRGAPSANVLHKLGFKQVYVVSDGFEGGTLKSGDKKGWRLKNGWKNAGLPWSYKLNREKMYYRKRF